jgi:hypothetical protein
MKRSELNLKVGDKVVVFSPGDYDYPGQPDERHNAAVRGPARSAGMVALVGETLGVPYIVVDAQGYANIGKDAFWVSEVNGEAVTEDDEQGED